MVRQMDSSSDEDEEHNAALRSVAIDSDAVIHSAAVAIPISNRKARSSKYSKKGASRCVEGDGDNHDEDVDGGLKFYQIRVQDLLHKHLDKVLEECPLRTAIEQKCKTHSDDQVVEDETYDGETRLFSNVPLGITLKRPRDFHPKARVLPARYDSSDEDSAQKDYCFQTAAVDGITIQNQAMTAQARARTRFIAAEAAALKAFKVEEEVVARLRQNRGEQWLPSVAAEKMKEIRSDTEKRKAMGSSAMVGVVANYRI